MRLPWHLADPDSYAKMKAEVEAAYPDLRFSIRDGCVLLRGSFPIKENQDVLDRYVIEVRVPQDFSKRLPVVREIGGRIPWDVDRHVDGNGEACLFVPDERWKHFPAGGNLRDFLDGPVRSFLIGQSVLDHTGMWPFGQRSHGDAGILEAYAEMFNISPDRETVMAFLGLLSRREIKGHWLCPCGKGKILRKCHGIKVRELRDKIERDIVRQSLMALEKDPKSNSVRAMPFIQPPTRCWGRLRENRGTGST